MHAPLPSDKQEIPGKILVIAIVQLVAGFCEIVAAAAVAFYILFFALATLGLGFVLFPIPLLLLGAGTLSVCSGLHILNRKPSMMLARWASVLQLACILGCDCLSFAVGLVVLNLLGGDDVKACFARRK